MPGGETGSARSPATADSFAGALRRAIVNSGLGLERLQARLLARGVRLSTATLSYWQSGRSEPGRRSSLAALAHLEEVLKVAPGSLAAHLAKPSGQEQPSQASDELDQLLTSASPLPEPLLQLELRYRPMLTPVSEHHTLLVGDTCAIESRWVRQVLTADVDGADRFLVTYRLAEDDPSSSPEGHASGTQERQARDADIVPLAHCDVGAVHRPPSSPWIAHELHFDRTLARGESIIIEYKQTGLNAWGRDRAYEIGWRQPLREFILEVQFDAGALPSSASSWQSTLDGSGESVGAVSLDSTHCFRLIRHSLPPGRYGVRWSA